MPLSDAVKALAVAFGADAAVLARHHRNHDRAKAIALFDEAEGSAAGLSIRRPFVQDVLGYLYSKSRAATVWFMSDHIADDRWTATQTLKNWLLAREMREIVVIVLAGSLQQRDYIEFHFTRSLTYNERLELEGLVPTLVRSWSGRMTGLVTQAKMDDRMVRHRAAAQAGRLSHEEPILGMSNPARLSRAEFRVCLMLARGLSVKAVTDELGLSEATIRSHLRSIYSKTETSGMQELMYRILSGGADEALVARSVR